MILIGTLAVFAAAQARAFDPTTGDFSKRDPNHVRILCWNVHNNFIYTTADDGAYRRVIKAVNPDIIGFQEMEHSLTVAQINARLVSYFPGSTWHTYLGKADGGVDGVSNRNVISSRFPLSMTRQDTVPTSDIRGVCMAMIDLPNATYNKNLYLMVAHFKAGGEPLDHQKRQEHADAIINWMRDARTAGGSINLPAGTPIIFTGDTNMAERGDAPPYHPRKTLLDGTIYDTARFGTSSPPDWDGTDNYDASPYDYNNGLPWTHGSANPVSRIDRFYYTDSVVHHTGGFVLNSRTMTAAARSAAGGILVNDTSGASDHLPVVTDYALGPDLTPPGQLVLNEYNANDIGTNDKTFLEIKNVGGREINLKGPIDYWIKESDPLPSAVPTLENEQYAFDLLGVVPPGGLFVIYDEAGQSSGIKDLIQSRLPLTQRQNIPGFALDNDNNTAAALVEQTMTRRDATFETVVEAYGWASPDPSAVKYFRLDSGNNRLITLGPAQWTSYWANGAASDLSASRNAGDLTLNNYSAWTIPASLTPGLENSADTQIEDWMMY